MTHTNIDQLNRVIEEFNPFESNFVVKSQHVWDEDFFDFPSLHAQASDRILQAVRRINTNHASSQTSSTTTSFALIAPKGVGKTHVLSRIRYQLKRDGNGFFIYMCDYGDLSRVKPLFLQSLASSLKRIGSQGVMQWQELATALVSHAMQKEYLPQQLIQQFPKVIAQKPQVVNQLTTKVYQFCPEIDNQDIIKALLWTLYPDRAPYAISWLAGRELSEAQAKAMDLPNPEKQDRDIEAFDNARQILDLISHYTTPVICFDELDGTEIASEENPSLSGFTRAQTVASLAKDLYNSLKRGVLLTAMYAKTWNYEFTAGWQLQTANAAIDRIAHEKLELSPNMKPDDVVSVVSHWLGRFYNEHGLKPPHSVYPFKEDELRDLGKDEPVVRDVLQWCAQNFGKSHVTPPTEKLKALYKSIEASLEDYLDDNERIANAIAFSLDLLIGQTVEGVTLKGLDREVRPKKHYGFINFRILGDENGKDVKIGVAVVQNSNGNSVKAAIKYLTQYSMFDLSRGCLVRAKSIQSHWTVTNQYLDTLQNELGGEWVSFKDEEIKPLLALYELFKSFDRDVISEEAFQQFVEETHPLIENSLIREILSDPSGEKPDDLIDEDDELAQLLQADSPTESDNLEDLELLFVA
jgi:hypothetical protein